MDKEKKFEKAWVDLREFGWGIREVRFIWPEGHDGGQPGPDSVGTDEIIDGGVHQEDLDPDIEAGEQDIDSIFDGQQNSQNTDAGQGGGEDEDLDEGPAGETPEPVVVEEGD